MKVKMKSKAFKLLMAVLALTVLVVGQVLAATDNDFEVGTQNLNNTVENSAKVGASLKKPEKGWKRYDDTNSKISYIGQKWLPYVYATDTYEYKKTIHTLPGNDSGKMQFNFTGTKIRIITCPSTDRSSDEKILIDGKEYTINDKVSHVATYVGFEKTDLSNTEHQVEIRPGTSAYGIAFDAIDIDSNGELKPYGPVQEDIKASSLELNKNTLDLFVGQDETLVPTVSPDNASNKTLKWTSSDPSIATVDQNGKVVGVKPGKVTITVATQDGSNLSKTCEVTVKPIDEGKGILKVEMVTNDVYEYDIPVTEINKFIAWMKQKGAGDPFFQFSKTPTVGNIESRVEYLMYNQIVNFTVDKYK